MRYSKEALDRMAEQIDLLEYAEKTMDFTRKSKNYFTHCPLHVDNTPSLCINPENNLWYCHSCHKGGSIFQWMQTFEGLSFPEAIEKVADITGTDAHEYLKSETVGVFEELKRCNTNKETDLSERKILDFQKDYLEKYKDDIPKEWVDEGITIEALKKYNIMIDDSSRRIVYPVFDAGGNMISVKGRTRINDFKELKIAKYINLYPIGTIDFFQGWWQAYDEIIANKSVIIFEGVKSCMKSYGWGIRNTVAAETSELSEGQIKLLIKNKIPEVIIGFDTDKPFKNIVTDNKIKMLKNFCRVSVIKDTQHLLGEKMAPVDNGEEIYRRLLEERVII